MLAATDAMGETCAFMIEDHCLFPQNLQQRFSHNHEQISKILKHHHPAKSAINIISFN